MWFSAGQRFAGRVLKQPFPCSLGISRVSFVFLYSTVAGNFVSATENVKPNHAESTVDDPAHVATAATRTTCSMPKEPTTAMINHNGCYTIRQGARSCPAFWQKTVHN